MMTRSPLVAVSLAVLLSACTGGSPKTEPPAATASAISGPASAAAATTTAPPAPVGTLATPQDAATSALPTTEPAESASPEPVPAPAAPTPAATRSPRTYGQGVPWPKAARGPAPAAYGAIVTRRVATKSTGGTLASGLLLPRLDASRASPLVMTPCGHRVRLRAADVRMVAPGSGGALPKPADAVVVLIDPGHGGPANGAIGVDGSREKDRVLDIAARVATYVDESVGRVYMTRSRDHDATLEFRTALGDALRVDAAISVHLNAQGFTPLDRPGVETYGALSDPQGRRLAGVIYEAQRRFLEQFPGPWVGYRDAGAKYRKSARGGDYYGLLRRSHRPWVISESLFMTSAHDIALLDRPGFVPQLSRVIADATVAFTTTRTPGSGWVVPRPDFPPPAPPRPGAPRPKPCVDPAR